MKYLLLIFIICSNLFAANYLDENLKKYKWDDLEVVWLEDSSFPTYDITFYFHSGALTEKKHGVTQLMFDELTSGTTRYSRKEILDILEFYGASYGANVTHEYATFSLSGLVKDVEPSLKMVCHLFKTATYPVKEVNKTKARMRTGLKNLVNNHGALASRIFREVSLKETPYSSPVGGSLSSINKISARDLHTRLLEFNQTIKKKIYIKAPAGVKGIQNIIAKDCGWSGNKATATVKLPEVKKKSEKKDKLYFVAVPNANQAQIRIGTFLNSEQSSKDFTLNDLASRYIGGGFTSVLMQELRVKRGLTYTASAYSSSQSSYGRVGINTFTKNETIVDILKVTKEVIEKQTQSIPTQSFQYLKNYLKGTYLFGLESSSAFIKNLLFFDHVGRDYDEIYAFPKEVDDISIDQAKSKIGELFDWDVQTKLILGDKKLIKVLRKAGYKVEVLKYNKYL